MTFCKLRLLILRGGITVIYFRIQKKLIDLKKITHRSVIGGRKILWSNASDYMKVIYVILIEVQEIS